MRHRDPKLIVGRQHRRFRRHTDSPPHDVNLSAMLIHGVDILRDSVKTAGSGSNTFAAALCHRYRADPRLCIRPDRGKLRPTSAAKNKDQFAHRQIVLFSHPW
jgi:hypothetical protein